LQRAQRDAPIGGNPVPKIFPELRLEDRVVCPPELLLLVETKVGPELGAWMQLFDAWLLLSKAWLLLFEGMAAALIKHGCCFSGAWLQL